MAAQLSMEQKTMLTGGRVRPCCIGPTRGQIRAPGASKKPVAWQQVVSIGWCIAVVLDAHGCYMLCRALQGVAAQASSGHADPGAHVLFAFLQSPCSRSLATSQLPCLCPGACFSTKAHAHDSALLEQRMLAWRAIRAGKGGQSTGPRFKARRQDLDHQVEARNVPKDMGAHVQHHQSLHI